MAGRNRVPISVIKSHLTKEEIKARQESEAYYNNLQRDKLVPPEQLSQRAKLKYMEIVDQAFWLDNLSADLLASYVHSWDRWLLLVSEMEEQAETIEYTDEATGEIIMKPNPNRRAMLDYSLNMQQLSSKLGLGNIDRLKLVKPVDENKPENRFVALKRKKA